MIVHQLEFRVAPGHDAEVSGFLRHLMVGDAPPAGVQMFWAGKRLSRHRSEHIALTCWPDEASYRAGTDPNGVPVYLAERAELLSGRRTFAFSVLTSVENDPREGRIMRVYRGNVAAAAKAEWERRAAEQLALLMARDGLVSMWAGMSCDAGPDDEYAGVGVVSTWRDWAAVLAATGGHIDRLVKDTEFADLERPAGLDHYQRLEPDRLNVTAGLVASGETTPPR